MVLLGMKTSVIPGNTFTESKTARWVLTFRKNYHNINNRIELSVDVLS
jgi:hypothetical protein